MWRRGSDRWPVLCGNSASPRQPPLVAQCGAEIEISARIGMNRERLTVACHGFFQLALFLQHRTQVTVRLEKSGFDLRRLSVARRGFFEPAQRLQRRAQVEVCNGELRHERDRLSIAPYRLVQPARAAQYNAEVEMQFGRIGIQLDCLAETLNRVLILFLACEGIRQHVVQEWRVGVALEQCSGVSFRFRQPIAMQQVQQGLDFQLTRLPGVLGLHVWGASIEQVISLNEIFRGYFPSSTGQSRNPDPSWSA